MRKDARFILPVGKSDVRSAAAGGAEVVWRNLNPGIAGAPRRHTGWSRAAGNPEPPGGGSPHCSHMGKTGLCEALPRLTENTLLRNSFLLKFVYENSFNSLVLSSLKD